MIEDENNRNKYDVTLAFGKSKPILSEFDLKK